MLWGECLPTIAVDCLPARAQLEDERSVHLHGNTSPSGSHFLLHMRLCSRARHVPSKALAEPRLRADCCMCAGLRADRYPDRGVLVLCADALAGVDGGEPLQDAHGCAEPQPVRHGLLLRRHRHRHGQELPPGGRATRSACQLVCHAKDVLVPAYE